jgi:DNA-binding transcriptional ArsR family regulator
MVLFEMDRTNDKSRNRSTEIEPMQESIFEPGREDLDLASVLAALSDPVRLDIIAELHRRGEAICSTLVPDIPKSTRSHHLKVLREAGITRTRIEGTERHVSLRYTCLEARFPGVLQSILNAR